MNNIIRHFILFLKDLYKSRQIIFHLAYNDFKARFIGSYLGIVWAFIQPLVMIAVLWFVFQVGFRVTPVDDYPFILWISCGLIPWFFFADSLSSATNSLIEYSYLVKKVVFRTSVLPLVKVLSALFVHLFLIMFLLIIFYINGYQPTLIYIQALYYTFALVVFLVGLTWITSSLTIFLKDLTQVVAVFLQIGFWVTPILWQIKLVPEQYHFLFKINPMFYIVEGYRDTFIHGIWFWHRYNQGLYFWLLTLFMLVFGAFIFKKLRPHFSDIL